MAHIEGISESLRKAVESGDVPGVVAAAATTDGEIFEEGAGALAADSVIWIASMTKAITGAAAMQLVEQGKLGLDTPAAEILPELAKKEVLVGVEADGTVKTRPASSRSRCGTCSRTRRAWATTPGTPTCSATCRPRGRSSRPRCTPISTPLLVRAGRALGIFDLDRLGRADGRGGERHEARPLHEGAPLRSARHARHRLQDHRRHAPAKGRGARAQGGRRLHRHRPRAEPGARRSSWAAARSIRRSATISASPA